MATIDCRPCDGRGIKDTYAQPVWLCSEQIQEIIDGLPDHEFIYESVCFRETADNSVKHERVTIVPFLNDVQQATITLWYLDDGTVTAIAPIGIERCITDKDVVSTDNVEVADFTIPAGFLQGSILIRTGTATINGAARPTGYVLNLPPMVNGDGGNNTYPAYAVTLVTGIVEVNFHRK